MGERWQLLAPDEKGPYEKEALRMKENYHTEMNLYKLTEEYRSYQEYLADFKAKNSGSIGACERRRDAQVLRADFRRRWKETQIGPRG